MTPEERRKLLDEVDDEVARVKAGDIAKLSGFSEAELKAIVPAAVDRGKLDELMAIVGDATLSNKKKAAAINAVAGLSKIAIGLAAKIAKA